MTTQERAEAYAKMLEEDKVMIAKEQVDYDAAQKRKRVVC
ncbi:hypothetical protein BMETH_1214_1 [methanotrophic bacterial endosymbiont of Bathymodiolus sp.]|nr:hypothetical protein BMETH_1214_1 [methanotrophic bacterial endosymbiont of Bathymodiolus sp.]